MNDETLKEEIDTWIRQAYVNGSLDVNNPEPQGSDVCTELVWEAVLKDRERAVRENTPVTIMGKTIEEVWVILSALELEHIEDMKMTMSNLDRWMKRVREDQNKAMLRAIDNSYSQLSNPTQTKKTK